MKKIFMFFCSLCVSVGLFTSCSSDDEVKVSELEKSYFSIENAVYEGGTFPVSTNGTAIDGLSINSKALTGGMNFITVITEQVYKKFFIGVKGVEGYWVYEPDRKSVV